MKCIKCGHELKDGAVYCIRCGAMQVSMEGKRLTEQDLAPIEPAAPNPSNRGRDFKAAPENNVKRIIIFAIVLAVIAIVVGVFAYSCMSQAGSNASGSSAATATYPSTSSVATSSSSSSATSSSASSSSSSSASSSSSSAAATTSDQTATADQQPAAQGTTPAASDPEPDPTPAPQTTPVGSQVSNAPQPTSGAYVLADSSSRLYSRSELESMSASDLYYARNEIFARHGRMFYRSDLQDYFDSKSWYNATYTPEQWASMGDQLSDIERQNSVLMQEVENSKGSSWL